MERAATGDIPFPKVFERKFERHQTKQGKPGFTSHVFLKRKFLINGFGVQEIRGSMYWIRLQGSNHQTLVRILQISNNYRKE
jgi:hypothetical protein